MNTPKRVLVAPLNWGLGHASRSIPIINALLEKKHLVYLASDGHALTLLNQEFPQLSSYTLPSYDIKYPTSRYIRFWLRKVPELVKVVQAEHAKTIKLIKKHAIDVIIADNRYGVYHENTRNILITHQLNIAISNPLKYVVNNFLRKQIESHFDECWIPDLEGPDNLSGSMSKGNLSIPVHFIGPLSRFKKKEEKQQFDLAIVLSGPEPFRTRLQNKLIRLTKGSGLRIVMILGQPNIMVDCNHIKIIPFCTSGELNQILNQSSIILSRSGYTSIMDYYKLNKKAILIPTPGQPEQIYLAQRHNKVSGFMSTTNPEKEFWEMLSRLHKKKNSSKVTFKPLLKTLAGLGF